MKSKWTTALFIAALAIVMVTSASIPVNAQQATDRQVAQDAPKDAALVDTKSLAGTWRGYPITPTGARLKVPVTIRIKDDGTYEAHGELMAVGKISLDDKGQLVYQGSLSSGTVTVHKDKKGGQSIKFWRDGDKNKVAGEYDRVN